MRILVQALLVNRIAKDRGVGRGCAIAAGFSALDLRSDFGGSIRQPAHFCGIYGFKPADRRVPTAKHSPEVPSAPLVLLLQLIVRKSYL
ncbi:MAG: amidase family protein [Nodosilinea sp.]